MLDVIGVSGTPAQAAERLRERNAFASRTSLVLYDESGDPDAIAEVVRGLQS
jgi:hypothetical protein